MNKRIELTEDNFGEIDEKGWYHLHVTKLIKQQILEDQKIVNKIEQWYKETLQPLPEGHIPIVSLSGVSIKIKEILEL